jgi:hypothetical protein
MYLVSFTETKLGGEPLIYKANFRCLSHLALMVIAAILSQAPRQVLIWLPVCKWHHILFIYTRGVAKWAHGLNRATFMCQQYCVSIANKVVDVIFKRSPRCMRLQDRPRPLDAICFLLFPAINCHYYFLVQLETTLDIELINHTGYRVVSQFEMQPF